MKTAGMTTLPGKQILAMAVLSILLTAPFGDWGITVYGGKVLEVEN